MTTLTLLGVLPLLGALAVAITPKEKVQLTKIIALATTVLVAIAGILLTVSFDVSSTSLQFVESREWIPSFGIKYALGVDGIALVLILLSVLLAPIVVLAGWNESEGGRWGVKTYYVLLLTLETMMIGVFASTDVFLFYVFFEAMLIPVYFLIGGYGSGDRAAAAVKFLLYSLFGGLLMLASIIGLFVISGKNGAYTFDIAELSKLSQVMSPTTQIFSSLDSLLHSQLRHRFGLCTHGFQMQRNPLLLERPFYYLVFSTKLEHLE